MEKWDLLRVLEVCITQNWRERNQKDLYPCEVLPELDFPRGVVKAIAGGVCSMRFKKRRKITMNEYEWCWWGGCYCKHACTEKSQAREYCEKDKSEACPAGLRIFDDDFEEDEENA